MEGHPGRISLVMRELRQHVVAQFSETLHYKPSGREFDSRWDLPDGPMALWPGVDSASDRNSARDIPWRLKATSA